jgi:hypothetical protein
MAWHPPRVETGELAQGYAIRHALTQFAQIPVLDPLSDEAAQDLHGAKPLAPSRRLLEAPAEIAGDQPQQFIMAIEKVAQALQDWLKPDTLRLPLQFREAYLPRLSVLSHPPHYLNFTCL